MNTLSELFTDNDLLYIIRTLLPENRKSSHMLRVLREDRDILEGMINDPALLTKINTDNDELLEVSPALLFAVLINAVRRDLKELRFTMEQDNRDMVAVFDSAQVQEFFEQPAIRLYLISMLSSFVKINSYAIPVRVRKGLWHKYRYSDFNIESLIRHIDLLEPDEQFSTLKRIADLCLFITGLFPETLLPEQSSFC